MNNYIDVLVFFCVFCAFGSLLVMLAFDAVAFLNNLFAFLF